MSLFLLCRWAQVFTDRKSQSWAVGVYVRRKMILIRANTNIPCQRGFLQLEQPPSSSSSSSCSCVCVLKWAEAEKRWREEAPAAGLQGSGCSLLCLLRSDNTDNWYTCSVPAAPSAAGGRGGGASVQPQSRGEEDTDRGQVCVLLMFFSHMKFWFKLHHDRLQQHVTMKVLHWMSETLFSKWNVESSAHSD